ncbi:MAG: hypothetical protein ABIN10_11305, partial [Specibacter sp.]
MGVFTAEKEEPYSAELGVSAAGSLFAEAGFAAGFAAAFAAGLATGLAITGLAMGLGIGIGFAMTGFGAATGLGA